MDSIGLFAFGVIILVVGGYAAFRIAEDPFAGLLFWILLLPVSKTLASFLGYVHGEGPYVLQKLTLADPVLLVASFASLVSRAPAGALGKEGRQVVGLLIGFCAVGIVSAIVGYADPAVFVELATYAWVSLSIVLVCRLVVGAERVKRTVSALRLAALIAIGACGLATILVWAGQGRNFLVAGGKVTGLFEAANQVQSFMIVVIPFLLVDGFRRNAPRGAHLRNAVLVTVAAMSVVSSGSRAGIVLVALAVWLLLAVTSVRACAVATCIAIVVGLGSFGLYEEYRADMPFAVRRSLSFVDQDDLQLENLSVPRANGLAVWKTVFAQHPLVGVGLDQFRNYVPRLVAGVKAQEAHDSYLAVLAETGIIGGMLIFSLLGTVLLRSIAFLRDARDRLDDDALAFARALFVAYVSLLLFGTLHNGLRQRYFWFVVALILCVPRAFAFRQSRVTLRAAAPVHRTTIAPIPFGASPRPR